MSCPFIGWVNHHFQPGGKGTGPDPRNQRSIMSAQLKDLTRLKQPGQPRTGLVKVSYGVHNLEAAIAGKSVSEVRQALKEPLNIDPRALALVNGRDVAASYILKQDDQLEFVRLAGEKGRDAD